MQFAGVASPNGVRIIVERSLNSSLDATAALLDSSGIERATGNLGSAAVMLEVKLIVGVQYALTINPSFSSSGSVRIRVERSTVSTDPPVWAKLFQSASPTVIADRREIQMNAAGHGAAIWLRQVTGSAPNLYYPSVNTYDQQTDSWSVRQTLDTLDAVTGNARPEVTVGVAANNSSIALWTDPRANSLGRVRWSRRVAGFEAPPRLWTRH